MDIIRLNRHTINDRDRRDARKVICIKDVQIYLPTTHGRIYEITLPLPSFPPCIHLEIHIITNMRRWFM